MKKERAPITDEMRQRWIDGRMAGTLDEVIAVMDEIKARTQGDNRVCVCGHAAKTHTGYHKPSSEYHTDLENRNLKGCRPGRAMCPCINPTFVLTASNSGMFLRKTSGPGGKHALEQGIGTLLKKGGTYEWADDVCCVNCKKTHNEDGTQATFRAIAIHVGPPMFIANVATPTNIISCQDCYSALGGS